jgi:hypothetical protein
VLRKILDPVYENGFCHIRYNNELHALFSEADIAKAVKIVRLLSAGHVIQMLGNSPI